jgi:hypothetical protein
VLGLFPPGGVENFYWTHPALESVKSARDFYAGSQWHNSGGDRTWLSPEVDLFFPNYPDLSTYFQPRQLDPGNYQVEKHGATIRLVNRLTLTMARSQASADLVLTKSVGPAPNPLRHERGLPWRDQLEYVGYSLNTSLEILGPTRARVGLWNLVQMPHGGDLLIPTYVKGEPKVYFGSISPQELLVSNHLVRYKMCQTGEHKLGLRAVPTAGRVGYFFQKGDRWNLIIRNFFVDPSGEYVDVPWRDAEDLGYSTQACNINSALGQFSELEYHIPAIGAGTGRSRCEDVAQVWAFRGPQDSILAVVRTLLSAEV